MTSGAFRHRYWNYYERGLSYSEGGFWAEAEEDFREALLKREVDGLRSRTYGLHFIEYFSHRELGIALFHQGRFLESIKELETSLGHVTSSKAQFFLDKARKSWLEDHRMDMELPEIICRTPADRDVVNRNKILVSGVATDDTFVKEILINGKPVQVDLSAQEVSFSTEVSLAQGENIITIAVRDLTGKTARLERTIRCDRLGPILSIYEPVASDLMENTYHINAYVGDDSGIRDVLLNGQSLACVPVSEVVLDCPVTLAPGEVKVVISAEDQAGNITTAQILLPDFLPGGKAGSFPGLLLASLDTPLCLLANADSHRHEGGVGDAAKVSGARHLSRVTRGGAVTPQDSRLDVRPGTNYALIIGIDAYEHWNPLKTAVNDALALKKILVERYAFEDENVRLLTDKSATRPALIDALMQMTSGLGDSDNLLVYFAGHGQLSEHSNDGYWIPVEGKRGSAVWSWIAHSAVKNMIVSEEVRANNIVVIADSCYGGKLARGGGGSAEVSSEQALQSRRLRLSSRKSRQIITSGSLEPVADWGRDKHSLFAYYLLKGLEENMEPVIDLKSIINSYVWEPVFRIGGQRPVLGRFTTPMDEDGEYVLCLKKESGAAQAVVKPIVSPDRELRERGADTLSPLISIKNWKDNHTVFLDHIFMEGRVTDDSCVEDIRINGRSVIKVPGKTIYFNHLAELKEGDNPFIIECVDVAGNRVRKEVHIYRKVRTVHDDNSRMSAALFPLEISGNLDMDLDSTLFDHLFDCDRFNMKQWQGSLSEEAQYDPVDISRLAKAQGIDFFITGKAKAVGNSLEIRARLIETETLDIVSAADVYDEGINREILDRMCRGLIFKLRYDLPLVEGKVVMVKGERVTINLGDNHKVKKGMHLIFFEEDEPVMDPETGEYLGVDTFPLGTARINKVLAKMSHAEVMGDEEVTGGLRAGQLVITK
ncbi:caspase family protein [Desulfoluna sp.]|uniref:caspase family protein n=1 Tax=Desulfoluna sp. TaxID=2045199 RepID=UPI0026036205|nr:caspase family protein [Desulfoluna sp.]